MTIEDRQDALREELARKIAVTRGLSVWERLPDKQGLPHGAACKEYCYRIADDYIQTFTKAGAVFQVDGSPDDNPVWQRYDREYEAYIAGKNEFAGYTKTASLKKEG